MLTPHPLRGRLPRWLHQHIGIFIFKIYGPLKVLVDINLVFMVVSQSFDENLHKHISHDLASDAGRESDPSSPDQPGLCVWPWSAQVAS